MALMVAKITINRAPVMTLWVAVVAERLGYDPDEALTIGKAIAGLNAQSKGRRLGIFETRATEEEAGRPKPRPPGEQLIVSMLGRIVPAVHTERGIRATAKGRPIDPDGVRRYREQKFGADLTATRAVMAALAASFEPRRLANQAYSLYAKFRPRIPEGTRGWGAAGELDLALIRSLSRGKES
jgi:hypothetical protein